MSVIKSKNYSMAPRDHAWDAGLAEGRIRTWAGGQDKENVDMNKYRTCFLWYDSENPENFTSYKLLYCDIIDGDPHVVFRALAAIVAVLNGGRGGVDIPGSDREGVYQEVAKQYRRFDEEPPELKRENSDRENRVGAVLNQQNRDKLIQAVGLIQDVIKSAGTEAMPEENSLRKNILDIEKRVVPAGEIEVRSEEGLTRLTGYAVKWDSESVGLPFIEVFRQGAFINSLNSNVVALWAHDSAKPLASTEAGNLKIQEDNIGLYFEMIPLETTWGKDALTSIANRVVSGMSFGFSVVDDSWGLKDGQSYREVTKAKLYEISPTPFPAYPETSVSARGLFYNAGVDFDRLSNILTTAQRNSPLTSADCDLINKTIKILQSYLPAKRENKQKLVLMRRRLELLEKIH